MMSNSPSASAAINILKEAVAVLADSVEDELALIKQQMLPTIEQKFY